MSDAPVDPDRHHVHVEVLALSLLVDDLGVRHLVGHLRDGAAPDEVAAVLASVGTSDAAVVHSTSWRHTHDAVVLTYAVLPDPSPCGAVRVAGSAAVAWSPDPARPGIADVSLDAVVAHACRHLTFLLDHDPHVAQAAGGDPTLWSRVRRLGVGVAGQLPRTLHPTSR